MTVYIEQPLVAQAINDIIKKAAKFHQCMGYRAKYVVASNSLLVAILSNYSTHTAYDSKSDNYVILGLQAIAAKVGLEEVHVC